jgi:hypothetical protein
VNNDWVKISLIANDLGVTMKTIYNWVSVGKLQMVRPGYVSQVDAYEVWLHQHALRSLNSYFQSQGTIRDSYGRFKNKGSKVEESGE